MRRSFLEFIILWLFTASLAHSATPWQSTVDAQPKYSFAESQDGFHVELSAIIDTYRGGDKVRGQQLIEQFRLPHPENWFTEHLGATHSAALTERYDKLFAAFAAELERNILEAIGNQLNLVTELKEGGENPLPIPTGLHPIPLSGLITIKQTPLFYSRFDRQRNGKSTASWARAFTYEEGAFRFIGYGSKPFWIWENDAAFVGSATRKPIQLAQVIHQVPAAYPASARAKGIEGKVVLRLSIDVEGKVVDTKVLSGDPALTQAAIDAARQWRFQAPIQNGSPIESDYIAEFVFANSR